MRRVSETYIARGKRYQIGADGGGVALLVESDGVPPLVA